AFPLINEILQRLLHGLHRGGIGCGRTGVEHAPQRLNPLPQQCELGVAWRDLINKGGKWCELSIEPRNTFSHYDYPRLENSGGLAHFSTRIHQLVSVGRSRKVLMVPKESCFVELIIQVKVIAIRLIFAAVTFGPFLTFYTCDGARMVADRGEI